MSDDTKAVFNPETGITNNYFGGQGEPDGPGHGHVGVNDAGEIDVFRDPYEPGVPNARRDATRFDTRH